MRRWQLTALYLASSLTLIGTTIGFSRAIGIVRAHTAPMVATAREIAPAAAPVPALDSPSAATPLQRKKPQRRLREYRLPIGSPVFVQLRTAVSSATSHAQDQVDAELTRPVTQEGVELIPAGSVVHGSVVSVVPGVGKGARGQLTLAFAVVQHAITADRAAMRTRSVTIEAEPPEAAREGKKSDRPVDVALPVGHPLVLTLADPLVVYIPER